MACLRAVARPAPPLHARSVGSALIDATTASAPLSSSTSPTSSGRDHETSTRARVASTSTALTVPTTPPGVPRDLSTSSPAASPKIARSSFSSGDSGVPSRGATRPMSTMPGFTSVPTVARPRSSRWASASSPRLGRSRVKVCGPSSVPSNQCECVVSSRCAKFESTVTKPRSSSLADTLASKPTWVKEPTPG